jgi:hypothetical protein
MPAPFLLWPVLTTLILLRVYVLFEVGRLIVSCEYTVVLGKIKTCLIKTAKTC